MHQDKNEETSSQPYFISDMTEKSPKLEHVRLVKKLGYDFGLDADILY